MKAGVGQGDTSQVSVLHYYTIRAQRQHARTEKTLLEHC